MFTAPVIGQSHIGNMAVGYSEVKGLGVLNEKHEAALLPQTVISGVFKINGKYYRTSFFTNLSIIDMLIHDIG